MPSQPFLSQSPAVAPQEAVLRSRTDPSSAVAGLAAGLARAPTAKRRTILVSCITEIDCDNVELFGLDGS